MRYYSPANIPEPEPYEPPKHRPPPELASSDGGNVIADWDLSNRFTYHPPIENQPEQYEMIRRIAYAYAVQLNNMCPDGREKALAMTKLEEVVFWANAAIARTPLQPTSENSNGAKHVS
jgi:hypothetical protein